MSVPSALLHQGRGNRYHNQHQNFFCGQPLARDSKELTPKSTDGLVHIEGNSVVSDDFNEIDVNFQLFADLPELPDSP